MSRTVFHVSQTEESRDFAPPPGYEAWGVLQSGTFDNITVLARVYRDVGAHGPGPEFLLACPSGTGQVICTVSRPLAGDGQRKEKEYAVHGSDGGFVGCVAHGRSPCGVRQAWRIRPQAGGPVAVGYKGALRGWVTFWGTIPLLPVLTVVGLLHDGGGPSTWMWGMPKRIAWRGRSAVLGGRRVLRFTTYNSVYDWDSKRLGKELAYAQAILYWASGVM
ncbi:hypothetical protein AB0B79_18510 [Streptomyces sp. NPDC039022]|uniref:hypothetical protein n=1 Tax=Streptomyces sp. NPDC039022 TaxID=3157091 RepID=UPI0033D768CD